MLKKISVLIVILGFTQLGNSAEQPGKSILVIKTFEEREPGPYGKGYIESWRWTKEQKKQAPEWSQLSVVEGQSPFGQKCLKVKITKAIPWGEGANGGAHTLSSAYDTRDWIVPPAADVLRLQVKVLSGRYKLGLYTDSSYYTSNSHVIAESQWLEPKPGDDWQQVDISLYDGLKRDYFGYNFADWKQVPVAYFTRWLQHKPMFRVVKDSVGEILIDQLEFINTGRSKDFPVFTPEQIKTVSPGVDFETTADRKKAFTFAYLYLDLKEPQPEFQRWVERNNVAPAKAILKAGNKKITWHMPAKLSLEKSGQVGKQSLRVYKHYTEEHAYTGMLLSGHQEANAIQLTMKSSYPEDFKVLMTDFLVYVMPEEEADNFPWPSCKIPGSWDNQNGLWFDYLLGRKNAPANANYAIYQARRGLRNKQWENVVIPLADFVCFYGQGKMRGNYKQQLPLPADQITALAFLVPHYPMSKKILTTLIDDIKLVKVPGSPAELRSYWQRDDLDQVKQVPVPRGMRQIDSRSK